MADNTPKSKKGEMHAVPSITKDFLARILKKDLNSDLEVLNLDVTSALIPGENYGSCFSKITVLVESKEDLLKKGRLYVKSSEEKGLYNIHLVSKTMPTNAFFIDIFNSPVTFQKESDFYKQLVPAYESLCRKKGIPPVSFFPHCVYCSDGSDGNNAIILLEDLKSQGYANEDRQKGVSLPQAKMVLHELAWMHALSVALKLQEPQTYNELGPIVAKNFWHGQDRAKISYPMMTNMFDKIKENLQNVSGLPAGIMDKIEKSLKNDLSITVEPNPPREPYASIAHLDLWTNNIMFKCKEHTSEKVDCHPGCGVETFPFCLKLVDFQTTGIRSPVRDVLFFLYTSVPKAIRSKHLNEMLEFYCDEFRNALGMLGCQTEAKGVTLEWLNNEITENGAAIINQVLAMLLVVKADKSEKHAFSISEEELRSGESLNVTSDDYIDETVSAIDDFVSKGWF
ncbi:hypothetical protein J437_LFUL016788 [Ladona fulva]|uniref:CHK kinase-like domain-containing protein n=1 Tax=Ladona fulva TaxID=123851 RepID=A0A8K0KM88_LADFU|nr:hypothetical protein J437_LFUL016788 [Ladona fulva]